MENAVYIGLSQQMAMRRQLDVIANNLANVNTPAFRSEKVLFEEYLQRTPGGKQPLSFVLDYGVLRNTAEGELKTTGNPLDVALSGKGFLVVDTPEGQRYTRDGHLRVSDTGQLTTADGTAVLDDRGKPIKTSATDGPLTIAADGTISNGSGRIARLDVVQFENEQAMQKAGSGLYSTDEPAKPATGTKVMQGMIESSNVLPIVEVTKMLELQRLYESTQQLLNIDQNRQRKIIQSLAKVS